MNGIFQQRLRVLALACALGASLTVPGAESPATQSNLPTVGALPGLVTNLSQMLTCMHLQTNASLPVRFEGTVLDTNPQRGFIEMSDDTDIARFDWNLSANPLQPGQRVRIEGQAIFGSGHISFAPMLIDNDGRHGLQELSAVAHLAAGRCPIRILYFQYIGPKILHVRYEGPDFSKRAIPSEILSYPVDPQKTNSQYAPGLRYHLHFGNWQVLPNIDSRTPNRSGVVPNFDLSVAGKRSNGFAVEFKGCVEIEREGDYRFYIESDDGSRLFLGPDVPPHVEVLGLGPLPELLAARIGRPLSPAEEGVVMDVDGTVTFISEEGGTLVLELSNEEASMQLRIPGTSDEKILPILDCRVRARGRSGRVLDAEGEGRLGFLQMAGMDSLYLQRVPESRWKEIPAASIESLTGAAQIAANALVQVQGPVLRQTPAVSIVIGTEAANVEVFSNQRELIPAGTQVKAFGRWRPKSVSPTLTPGYFQIAESAAADVETLPLLTTALQVHSLTPEEAGRHYPVRLKGVATSVSPMRIQDATRGAFLERTTRSNALDAKLGGFYEVEGVTTSGRFAPNVDPRRINLLGQAQLPRPIRPTYEQLMSLSDTTQWAELEGVIQSISSVGTANLQKTCDLLLATKGGPVLLRVVTDPDAGWTNNLDNTLVRARGTISAQFNQQRQIQGAYLSVPSPSQICIVHRGPKDSFALRTTPVSSLMQFDPQGGLLHRVKVEGQITHLRDGACFLMDGTNGMIFRLTNPADVKVGDLVAVTGYQDLREGTPSLRRALVRKKGTAPLPEPVVCTADDLMTGQFNSARVRLVARLLSIRTNGLERVFEMQSNMRSFHARQDVRSGSIPKIPMGSRVELTGVCAGQASPQGFPIRRPTLFTVVPLESFDLLLNSPGDIRVLELPPRWTLKHALGLVTVLGIFALLALLWIYLLRRRVAERTVQLETANKELEAFSYSVSHDLRAPLRSIDGFSQVLLEDHSEQLDVEGRESLNRVRHASQRMEQLIDDMLMLSRLTRSELKIRCVDLSALAREIAAELRARNPERRVEFVIASGLVVNADANLMRVVLENLLGNAWKFTSKRASSRIEFAASRSGGHTVFFVRDDGAGFDKAFAGKLFGAFQRLHSAEEFEGTGVGLATVQRIIHRHRGRVWAESEVDKGATFYFSLPEGKEIQCKTE